MENNTFEIFTESIQKDKDRIQLSAPITEKDIAKFEKTYGVTLPEEYKIFLTQVSNGCKNNYFEPPVLSLEESIKTITDKSFLSKEYVHNNKWIIESSYPKDDASEEEIKNLVLKSKVFCWYGASLN